MISSRMMLKKSIKGSHILKLAAQVDGRLIVTISNTIMTMRGMFPISVNIDCVKVDVQIMCLKLLESYKARLWVLIPRSP